MFYSDDGGRTWTKSTSDLSSPCYPDFVGNNYGADEPCVLELKDGRLWMLMRTQTGFLYESFSSDHGRTWSEPLIISDDAPGYDLGYPSTVQSADDSLLTVWYEKMKDSTRAVLRQARWKLKV